MALSDVDELKQMKKKDRTVKVIEIENVTENVSTEMKIITDKKEFYFPDSVTIQIFLFKPYPVSGAGVSAQVTPPSGKVFEINFSENILVGSTLPNSGSYVAIITNLEEDGRYLISIQADDNGGQAYFATPFGEDVSDNQKKIEAKHLGRTGPFEISRMIRIQAFGYEGKAGLPPLKVTTLYASVESDHCIRLFWQIPLNVGPNGKYEIRYSSQCLPLQKAWHEAQLLFRGEYSRKGGDAQEHKTYAFGKGTYCFAVISENREGLKSEISNKYIVVIK